MASSIISRFFRKPDNLNREDANEGSSSSANSEFDRELLPPRLFATDRYPVSGRINSYSKPEYLLELAEVLAGTPELEWLKSSWFGGLFRLPVRRSSISGKLVHQLLCRSLVTAKPHEMWFVFAGRPIRFSLREFSILTGLNCGDYPPPQAFAKMITPAKKNEFEITKLIGPNDTYTIPEVIDILREDKDAEEADKMDTDRRKRLALVVIVDGIVACETSKVAATVQTSEMLKDLEAFMQYPWGRKSFELTLEMVKVGKCNRNVNILAEKFSQSHAATHGLTISFQLLILQAIPLLQQFLPDIDPNATFSDRPVSQLTICRTFHNSNILQVERDPNVVVRSILHTEDPEDIHCYSWDDEGEDAGVDYILTKLKDGHTFTKDDWHGGFDDLPPLSLPVHAKVKKPMSKRVKKTVVQNHRKSKVQDPNIEEDVESTSKVDAVKAEELLREVDRRLNEHTAKFQQMMSVERAIDRDEIRDIVLSVLREEGLVKAPDNININHTELLNQMNNSTWKEYGEGLPEMFNNISKVITDPEIGGSKDNESERDKHHDDLSEHGTSGDQYSSSSDGGGHARNNVDFGFGDGDRQELVHNEVIPTNDHAYDDRSDNGPDTVGKNPPVEDIGFADCDRQELVHNEAIPPNDLAYDDRSDNGPDTVVKNPPIECHVQDANDDHFSQMGAGHTDKDKVSGVDDGPEAVHNDAEVHPNLQTVESEIQDSADMEDVHMGKDHTTVETAQVEGTISNVFVEDAATLIEKESKEDNHTKLPQALSSTSAFSTSQPSETSETDEPASPSSKKRSLTPKELEESPLPTKRPRKKPKRYGQYESSCKKPILPGPAERGDYSPFRVVKPELKKKFMSTLRAYNQKVYIIDGHPVKSCFFEDIYTPKHWVDSQHMEAMLSLIWKTCGESFSQARIAVLDTWFTHILCQDHNRFQKVKNKNSAFPWNNVIKNYVRGIVPARSSNLAWFTDVDTVYVPMNWGKRHWVACVIFLKEGKIRILDPFIDNNDDRKLPRLMKPLLDMLPLAIKDLVNPAAADSPLPSAFTFERPVDVHQNKRTRDCGPLTVKFIELHAQGLPLDAITDKMVDEMRMSFAVDIYEEFVVSLG